MKKYILGIGAIVIALIGINQYGGGVGADTVTPIAGQTYVLAGSGVSSSDTSITLTSFTITQTGYEILDSDMSEIFYLTIEPGSRSRQEIVSCTTVTQNSDNTATLSGCERGLAPLSPYASSTDYSFAHSGGSTVIFSNPPQLYNQAAFKGNDEIITGFWSFPAPLSNENVATKAYVDGLVTGGTVSNDRLVVAGTAGETIATGTLIYFRGTDQEWYKVDTDDTTTYTDKFIGIAQGGGVNAGLITNGILLKGRDTTQTGLTAGSIYYASTSAGTITTATSAQPIGTAEDTNVLYFDPALIGVARLGANNTFTGTNIFSGNVSFLGGITGHANTVLIVASTTGTTTWTKQTGLEYLIVEVVGGGGTGSTQGGGGAGGYCKELLLASELSATTSIVVGSNASSSSFGSFCTANPGNNGSGADGGVGGTATGGDLNLSGGGGSGGDSSENIIGAGGNSVFGGGGRGGNAIGSAGAANTGGGGSGLSNIGGSGVVIITEYY